MTIERKTLKVDVKSRTIEFELHPYTYRYWPEYGGIYIFLAKPYNSPAWLPLYMGKAKSLGGRLPNHERWAESRSKGATHVAFVRIDNTFLRSEIEESLIEKYSPELNKHFVD
ncbi:MAG: hypothetical protein K6L75_03620 [Cellvibrionaceae bacterium]